MSPHREPVAVETGRIVRREWVCESKANDAHGVSSSGCRVLTLQGYDIEESVSESSDMIGGGYFQFGGIRFLITSVCPEKKGGTTSTIVPDLVLDRVRDVFHVIGNCVLLHEKPDRAGFFLENRRKL